MSVGAPNVIGPLSECNADTGVLVENQQTGAQVEIFVGGTLIASGVATGASQVFPLLAGATLNAGDEVRARQTVPPGGTDNQSGHSSPVQVHAAPPSIEAAQVFVKPLYACAECLWLDGLQPGAQVQIESVSGEVLGIGGTPAAHTNTGTGTIARIDLTARPVNPGETLRVVQTACGATGVSESPPAETLDAFGEVLPAPKIEGNLMACHKVVHVTGVFEGALVTLRRLFPDGTVLTPTTCVDAAGIHLQVKPPLEEGERITVSQAFAGECHIASAESDPPVTVGPPVPEPPRIKAPPCAGTSELVVEGLSPGQRVRIDLGDGSEPTIFEAAAPSGTFDVSPAVFEAGRSVTAAQELCDDWSAPSRAVVVKAGPIDLPTPVIPGPLVECAEVVRVLDLSPGVEVQIFSEQQPGGPINAPQAYFASGPGIQVAPPLIGVDIPVPALRLGDRLWAVQTGCALESAESAHVEVGPLPDEVEVSPSIVFPVGQCARAVPVDGVTPGALVDIRLNGEVRWTAAIGGTAGAVPITGRLHVGDALDARQRICRVVTGFGQGTTVIDRSRRNIAKVSKPERDRLRDAIVQLDMAEFYPDGVSKWDKQDQIHQATHVHHGPAFLPWHRELCNRFEALLREVDPLVSLHYWDWTTDPRASPDGDGGVVKLLADPDEEEETGEFGSSSGRAGEPFDTFDNDGVEEGSRVPGLNDPAEFLKPPFMITRRITADGAPGVKPDDEIIDTGKDDPIEDQYQKFRSALEDAHDLVHDYFGDFSTIGARHSAFEDPFVFLLHSNVDRLFAEWQAVAGREWRRDPEKIYGAESETVRVFNPGLSEFVDGILTAMQPWAGPDAPDAAADVIPVRPWTSPENEQVEKNSMHPSVVALPCYDTVLDAL